MATATVLAGGAGSRLGGAKATALFAGRPLIEHVVAAARAGGLEPVVVAKARSPLPPLDCPVLIEPDEPRHPLLGIVTALRELHQPALTVCACDMPFVTGPLLAWLAALEDPLAVTSAGGELQPLLGRYSASLLARLEAALAEGVSMREVAGRLGARVLGAAELERFGDPLLLCSSINTPAELEAAGG
ncbi:MAG TPA: molybdenum cofactor guanylyltransferase [Solirubrobacteraceae bacterium]|nr:molybdenum cofactor guanylyltransferase [Solirubrobacteraceae bacterium]